MSGKEALQPRLLACLALLVACVSVISCGGDDGPGQAVNNRCARPRAGIDTQGSLKDEKAWLRAWTDDLYLWYREVPNANAASYATAVDYFDALKTPQMTPSGKPKDQFHFTMSTADWEAFSESGVEAGYGVQWAFVDGSWRVVAAFVEPGSPAANAGIKRGSELRTVDGFDVLVYSDKTPIIAGLFPAKVGETHTFAILDPIFQRPGPQFLMTSANVTTMPVQNVKILPGTTVGYVLFNDHIATAENLLVQAISDLKAQGATDLVLDIRYNGGGYLAIASELAYMISGPSTAGKPFETLTFNDKHTTTNPVTGQPLTPTPFLTTTVLSSERTPLPTLGLSRVFVLTGGGTCSASESVINGLRGQDIEVIQIGGTTCGKPYGFYPADNCGTTYFSIQLKGVNAKGFGDYSDGFTPKGTDLAGLPGCQRLDDLTHELGDPDEGLLQAALLYRAAKICFLGQTPAGTALSAGAAGEVRLVKSPWRENRILVKYR